MITRLCSTVLLVVLPALAQTGAHRYAVILDDNPALSPKMRSAAAEPAQARVRAAAEASRARVLHSTTRVVNAVYIAATPEQAKSLERIPGVRAVVKVPVLEKQTSRALELVNAQGAWNAVGGEGNAGAGVRIGIIDTGIDHTHPAFQAPGLTVPGGFPKCAAADCSYTNNKIIAARSYVNLLAVRPTDTVLKDTRPDDLSPRDRVGHGTAVAAAAAGIRNNGPAGTVAGVAPGAFLGNYKVFGSPGVNDVTYGDVILRALDDAVADGMNIVTLAFGKPGVWYYSDRCGTGADAYDCDVWALAAENAARAGLTIVASAGNEGDASAFGWFPNLNSITSPGTAPSVITVGATTNSHAFYARGRVEGGPASLNPVNLLFGDGPRPAAAISAPVRDVTRLNNDGRACDALPAGSLAGAFALIIRGATGDCSLRTKIQNAQNAGALAVVFYRSSGDFLAVATGLLETGIPSVTIGNTAGVALKDFVATNNDARMTLDPTLVEATGVQADEIAYFSSQGPNVGDYAIKPEVVAPGTGLYVATQKYDPNGDMWSPNGYTVIQGTSYAAGMVAGAAAVAKQRQPGATAAHLKSMVVNTATADNIFDYDANNNRVPARVTAMGAGKLNAGNAAQTTLAIAPATLSFGLANPLPPAITLRITNLGNSQANVSLRVVPRDNDTRATLRLSTASVSIGAGQTSDVVAQLTGSVPSAGSYEGYVEVTGGAVPLRVPYLYLVGDGQPDNTYQITGTWTLDPGMPGNLYPEIDFKVVDQFGVPVVGLPYQWTPNTLVDQAGTSTDNYGIGYAYPRVPSGATGPQTLTVNIANQQIAFPGLIRQTPSFRAQNPVVDAASFQVGRGLAPGSYITIYGSALSPAMRVFESPYLPVSLAGVSVSFDSRERNLSLPGRIHFVRADQINVQIPWEFEGLTSVLMKVSIGDTQSAQISVPLSQFSPNFFEYSASGTLMPAALDESFALIGPSNPVRRGRVAQLYVNGLGPVDSHPASGEATPSSPLPTTRTAPVVTIGGQSAPVQFSGLAPGIVGLYQVNVVVPEGLAAGTHDITIAIGGVTSKVSRIAVQ